MSEEKRIVEGVGRAGCKLGNVLQKLAGAAVIPMEPVERTGMGVSLTIARAKLEKYNDQGELVQTIVEDFEKNADH